MADYITKIHTIDGDKQIDYNALANLPDIDSIMKVDDTLTQDGFAADAKTTGDAIDSVRTNINQVSDTIVDLSNIISANYDESIIGLSIDGTTVTCIKGDGSTYSFETQDTNTTHSLGTDTTTGLTKLYATIGSAEDGTMTQKAIKTELDKKVGVVMNDATNTLIFTI